MPEIFKIIKTIPQMDAEMFERALTCDKFWEACIKDLDDVHIETTGEGCMHWKLRAHFMLDPVGITKIPVDLEYDLLWKPDPAFKGDGKKWLYWTENSNAVTESVGSLSFKASSSDTKIMVELTKINLKSDFLDIAGLGKAMVINRLQQEMQKMVLTLIDLAEKGEITGILENC